MRKRLSRKHRKNISRSLKRKKVSTTKSALKGALLGTGLGVAKITLGKKSIMRRTNNLGRVFVSQGMSPEQARTMASRGAVASMGLTLAGSAYFGAKLGAKIARKRKRRESEDRD